ncbi:hypothetical protein Tco_1334833 [Tanacetum coccineum]
MGHSGSWLSRSSSNRTLPNLTTRSRSSSGIVRGGRIRGDKKDGGSGGVGASSSDFMATIILWDGSAPECTQVHDPPALWDQVHTLENVVPAPTTVGQPPRKESSE